MGIVSGDVDPVQESGRVSEELANGGSSGLHHGGRRARPPCRRPLSVRDPTREERRALHEQGWTESLERLQELLSGP
jgi:hypothetical protein